MTIGKGCWIVVGVVISGGVTICDNVIIGGNSVVTKDIHSFSFSAGIPSNVIGDLINMNK